MKIEEHCAGGVAEARHFDYAHCDAILADAVHSVDAFNLARFKFRAVPREEHVPAEEESHNSLFRCDGVRGKKEEKRKERKEGGRGRARAGEYIAGEQQRKCHTARSATRAARAATNKV